MNYNKKYICLLLLPGLLCICLLSLTLVVFHVAKMYDHFKLKFSAEKFQLFKYEDDLQINPGTIKRLISKCNREERVSNLYLFGEVKADTPILVIFVDKYQVNFEFLLGSLSLVGGIGDVLIIFSHSSFDKHVNSIINTISFARVVQIYYPYSLQVYPNEFPGYQQGNCATNTTTKECHDQHRNPELAQKKHFWWWTMNHVFENMTNIRDHKGMFIFMEDDLFLMEDFIYMIIQMQEVSKSVFHCDFITLATARIIPNITEIKVDNVNVKIWDPNEHTSVLAFDSDVWKNIVTHYDFFCNFDDYSWSRTLFYLSLYKKHASFKVISSSVPRAYKISEFTAVIDKYLGHNLLDVVAKIVEIQNINEGLLFPKDLEVVVDLNDVFVADNFINNGSWSDPRDKEMCTNITEYKPIKFLVNMTSEYVVGNGVRITV